MFISRLRRDVTKKWFVIKNNRFSGDRIISTPRTRWIARTISRGEMHCPKLQPSGWGIEDTRRSEEEGRARLSLAEGSDLLCFAAGWRPPTRRSASPMLLLWSRGSSSLSLTILAKVRDAVKDRWNRRAKEDAKERRRKKDGAPAREAAPEADLESVRARGPSDGKEKDKIYNKLSLSLSLPLFFSLYTGRAEFVT